MRLGHGRLSASRGRVRCSRAGKTGSTRSQWRVFAHRDTDGSEPSISRNKLKIPYDSLASIAGGIHGQPSKFSADILDQLADLPMTDHVAEYRMRADALQAWKTALQRGTLPDASRIEFPVEPFRTKFLEALSSLEMPRFTRRYPKLTDALLRQMLDLTREFEVKYLEKLAEEEKKQQQRRQQQQQQQMQASGTSNEGDEGQEAVSGSAEGQTGDAPPQDAEDQQMEQQSQDQMQGGGSGSGNEMQLVLEDMQQGDAEATSGQQGDDGSQSDELSEAMEAMAGELAEELVDKFEEQMAPIVDSLEAAMGHLGDLDDLLDGPTGWDLSSSLWQKRGWREFKDLRKKLENLRELRDLVRSLGRGGGRGPLRRAPEEVWSPGKPAGVIRSPLVPEEVRGLCRSGSLSQMLPAEAALLAAGWPREQSESDEESVEERGSHPARLLFMARLAEKGLMAYERAGWIDDEPARTTGRLEIRPAAELGPIIVCLDTSGSMRGAREVVAKALVLECMRGAHNQNRKCFVYAFSGPGEVESMELDVSPSSLARLLDFLQGSFSGGTDVDAPLELSLTRLASEEWEAADILMVTDGEIRPPSQHLLQQVERYHQDLGLEVHGLLVGTQVTPAMEQLCTHLHLFKSWSAVGGSKYY